MRESGQIEGIDPNRGRKKRCLQSGTKKLTPPEF